ncbi:putative acyltransferase ChoActase/COT/CPT, choline/carnitine acyltransferase [Globisporangium polare]
MLSSDSPQQLDTKTPVAIECERMMQLLVAENARLARKQEQLQLIVADLSEVSECQSVALAYVDELVAKYGRREDCVANGSQTGASLREAAAEVFELEEL